MSALLTAAGASCPRRSAVRRSWKENAGDSSGLIQRAGPVQSDGAAATEGEDAMNVLRGKVVLKETSVGIPGL